MVQAERGKDFTQEAVVGVVGKMELRERLQFEIGEYVVLWWNFPTHYY